MTLWRKTRTELAGAWRSLRYDLDRRSPAETLADVTYTGMNTFGGAGAHRRPRRTGTVAAFGALAVAGATGSYFAVVSGIGALTGDDGGVEPYPLAAAAPGDTHEELSNEGFGAGSAHARKAALPPARGTVQVIPATAATTTAATPPPTVATTAQPRTTTVAPATTAPAEPDPCCLNPPVPTPTAVPSAPDDPSPAPSATDTATPGSPQPTSEPSWTPPGEPSATNRASHAQRP